MVHLHFWGGITVAPKTLSIAGLLTLRFLGVQIPAQFLFVFGLASLVYPPLRTVINSVTTSVAMTAGGLALMVLPTLVVGHEKLILGAVGVAVGGWFVAHRHGQLKGLVDANKNGVDDRLENRPAAQ